MELYKRVTAEFAKRRDEHEAKYKDAVNHLANRPITEVIGDYVSVRKHWFALESQIRRVRWGVVLDRFSPLELPAHAGFGRRRR
jgi:type II secretory pathway component PulK